MTSDPKPAPAAVSSAPAPRKNILFVSGILPSLKFPSGGQAVAGRILQRMAASHNIWLVAFCNKLERNYLDTTEYSACKGFWIFELTLASRLKYAILKPGLPLPVSGRCGLAEATVRKLLHEQPIDEIWIEYIQAAALLELVPPSLKSTLVVHDFLHQFLERGAGAAPWWKRPWLQFEAARTRRWEREIVKKASHLLTSNDKDREIAAKITGRKDVVTRYSEIDPLYSAIKRDPAKLRKGVIFFWGLMSRPENEDAMVWFASEIFPKILRHRPLARLVIAGAEPSKAVLALKGERIDVLGFVKDPVPLFESVEMAVAPLRLGSGLKIKVVEFQAAGIPTVATIVGAEGVKPSSLLVVANEPEAFAQACLKFLSE